MGRSQLTGGQIKDGSINRDDIDTITIGKSLIAKIVDGNNGVKIDSFTGADSGTGDVSLKLDLNYLNTRYVSLTGSLTQNLIFASPSSGSGSPTFRPLTSADIPTLPYLNTNTASNLFFPRDKEVTTVRDANNVNLEGVYYGYQWTNTPVNTIGILTVKRYSPDWIRQEFNRIDGSGITYVRDRYNGNTWGNWEIIATRNWIISNYVDKVSNEDVGGVKRYTGTYSQWVLNGDAINNARGFVQSLPNLFYVGTLNDKNLVLFRNDVQKVTVGSTATTFHTNIIVPNGTADNHGVNLGQLNSANYFPINFSNAKSSVTYQGNMLAVPTGSYSSAVSAQSTNLPYANSGGLISFGQINNVSGRILSPRDNTDNWFFQSGDGTGAWGQFASRSWVINTALTNYYTKSEALGLFVGKNGVETIQDTKTFTHSPVIPTATLNAHSVNLGQASEVAQELANSRFLTLVFTSSGDVYDMNDYDAPKLVNIICKTGGSFTVNNISKDMTIKIRNPHSAPVFVFLNSPALSIGIEPNQWAEFTFDKDNDITMVSPNGCIIL